MHDASGHEVGDGKCSARNHYHVDFDSETVAEEMKFLKRRSGTAIRLSVTARWDFEVRDEEGFLAYVRQRLATERGYHPEGVAEHTKDVEQAMLVLFEMDGWSGDYHKAGLVDAGSGYNVGQVDRTLFDMNDDERMESGF